MKIKEETFLPGVPVGGSTREGMAHTEANVRDPCSFLRVNRGAH